MIDTHKLILENIEVTYSENNTQNSILEYITKVNSIKQYSPFDFGRYRKIQLKEQYSKIDFGKSYES